MFKVRAPRRKARTAKQEAPHGPARSHTRPATTLPSPQAAKALLLAAGAVHAGTDGVFADGLRVY